MTKKRGTSGMKGKRRRSGWTMNNIIKRLEIEEKKRGSLPPMRTQLNQGEAMTSKAKKGKRVDRFVVAEAYDSERQRYWTRDNNSKSIWFPFKALTRNELFDELAGRFDHPTIYELVPVIITKKTLVPLPTQRKRRKR